ncbi:MAG: XdhC family protein [Sphaerochaetaceae bacterium]|nr:XdhC family protein [Sphaerochaetaceae bacterium]
MNTYFNTITKNLNKKIERRTRIDENNLGNEAIYDTKNNLLAKNSEDLINDGEYLCEFISGKLELVMCGGGHIGNAIYKLALMLDYKITIIEDRSDFCTPELYPKANLILGDYSEELNKLDLSNCAIVIATRGHKHDKTCLETALSKKNYKYLGMIGSKSKVAATKNEILNEIKNNKLDCSEEELNSIYSPIGININAQTPQEIAISIVAEIIKATKMDKNQIELDVELLRKLAKANNPFVVARIIEKHGSAPREQGSFLAVFSNGKTEGTIGGGAIEYQVIKDSKELLNNKNKNSQLFYHDLSNSKASKLGMICGGNVKVLLTKFIS